MPSPLFNQLQATPQNSMLQRILEFKRTVSGDPRQMVQNMLNSGRISQSQINHYIQQTNELYRQFKGMM